MGHLEDLRVRLAYLQQSDANRDAAAELEALIAEEEGAPRKGARKSNTKPAKADTTKEN